MPTPTPPSHIFFVLTGNKFRPSPYHQMENIYRRAAVKQVAASSPFLSGVVLDDSHIHPHFVDSGQCAMLSVFDPHIHTRTKEQYLIALGIDSIILHDLCRLANMVYANGSDVVGVKDWLGGGWSNGVLGIRKGSKGADAVWEEIFKVKLEDLEAGCPMEQEFVAETVRRTPGATLGTLPDWVCQSYKVMTSKVPGHVSLNTEGKCPYIVQFHGHPKPHAAAITDPWVRRLWGGPAGWSHTRREDDQEASAGDVGSPVPGSGGPGPGV